MSCIEDDPLLFMKEIDWFKNCLDEEVVKSLLQKIERIIETEFVDYDGWGSGIVSATVRDNYHYEMLHSLRDFMYDRKGAVKFSCGYDFIKYLCNRVDRPIR